MCRFAFCRKSVGLFEPSVQRLWFLWNVYSQINYWIIKIKPSHVCVSYHLFENNFNILIFSFLLHFSFLFFSVNVAFKITKFFVSLIFCNPKTKQKFLKKLKLLIFIVWITYLSLECNPRYVRYSIVYFRN